MAEVTEQRPVAPPVVIGFLRPPGNTARGAALTAAMREYCTRHELVLTEVVTEQPHRVDEAFATALDSMVRTRAYGLLVPSRSHLGVADLAGARAERIARAGLHLIVIRAARRLAAPARAEIEARPALARAETIHAAHRAGISVICDGAATGGR